MSKASAELCSRYSAFLRVKNSLKPLMETLFHVMPMKVSALQTIIIHSALSLKSARKVCYYSKLAFFKEGFYFFEGSVREMKKKMFFKKEEEKDMPGPG